MKTVEYKLPVLLLREEGSTQIIASCPVLDLASMGRTQDEAVARLREAIRLFFDGLEELGTTDQVLGELGWKKVERPSHRWIPPHILQERSVSVQVPAFA